MDVPGQVVAAALRALDSRGAERVLDVVADSDLEHGPVTAATRRLRFQEPGLVADVVVQAGPGLTARQVLVRLTPPVRCTVSALCRGHELTVPTTAGRTDANGVTRLSGVPRGVTSLRIDGLADGVARRTAWLQL